MEKIERLLLKPLDAAAMLSISRSKIYEMISQGSIPSVKLGNMTRIPRVAIENLIEGALKPASHE